MAGPFTAFVFGDPSVSDVFISDVYLLGPVGFASSASPVPFFSEAVQGVAGSPYSATIVVVYGAAPFSFSITSGALPGGLALNSASGVISGTPTAVGSSDFTISVTDSGGNTGSQSFTMTVSGAASGGAGNWGWIH